MLRRFGIVPLVLAAFLAGAAPARATGVGTAFTFQGRIDRGGSAVTDTYTMILRLYDASGGGTQIGTDQVLSGVVATNGLFTVTLDFGAAAFTGQARWLDIQVKGSADGAYTALTPRQPLTPAPYALYALNGGTGTGPWISDGNGNITYTGGAAGITGQSTHTATGIGVFFDGGITAGASVYGYNYNTAQGIPLYLNSPGGNVLVGSVTSPGQAKLDVLAGAGMGVQATTKGSTFFAVNAAVRAVGNTGTGPSAATAMGVYATSTDDRGVWGASQNNWGVSGDCLAAGTYGILGTPNEGIYGYSPSTLKPAAHFVAPTGGVAIQADGMAKVKTLQILGGADLAERFEVAGRAEPGTVMAIDASHPGRVTVASGAYCHTVAGVVSGAHQLNAGVELGTSETAGRSVPLALSGRVWVRGDATRGPIRVGDLITTSDRDGYAMVATDHARAQGAILGKAMSSLRSGTGMVLVLVSLQ